METRSPRIIDHPIRARVTHGPALGAREKHTVYCTVREQTMPLATCMGCERCVGLCVEPDGAPSHITCITETQHGAPPAAVGDVMSRRVLCIEGDVLLPALRALLLEHEVGGAPVVDAGGQVVGMVSKTDLLREAGAGLCAKDVMMPVPFAISERAPIVDAAALMAMEAVHQLPVVSDVGEVVGIIGSLDILSWFAREHGYLVVGPDPGAPRSS